MESPDERAAAVAPPPAATPEEVPGGSREAASAAPGPFEHLGRRLLVPALLALLVLAGLALFADARQLADHLAAFPLALLAPVLGLSLVNYALRFVRWELYLRALGVRLPLVWSAAVLLVGFVLSVTPGKAGELGKAWLVRELGGGPALRVVPAVLAERITDLLGVVLLIGFGALALPGGAWIAAATAVLAATVVALLSWRRASHALLGLAARVPRLAARVRHLEEMLDRLRALLSPRLLFAALALSIVAWGAEGVGFFLVVRGYAPEVGLLLAVFDYSASTLAGALSMLPAGLVASEGSLAALLGAQGLGAASAASATLIIRAATLWFAVALGLAALPAVWRRIGRASR